MFRISPGKLGAYVGEKAFERGLVEKITYNLFYSFVFVVKYVTVILIPR